MTPRSVSRPSLALSSFSSFGVGGSRRPSPCSGASAAAFVASLRGAGIPASSVFTSCGAGAPSLVAAAFPGCQFFSAAAPAFCGLGSRAFAARAAALVRALAASPAPLWVCFPGGACPAGVIPRRSWVSCGSGSWSECALAAGLGVPVLVFLPVGVVPPSGWGGWSSLGAFLGGGWWFLPAFSGRLF